MKKEKVHTITFTEFYAKRRAEFEQMSKKAKRRGILNVREKLLEYCNAHPTELNPAPVKMNTIIELSNMRGNIGYRKVNDLMQQFASMLDAERRKKNRKWTAPYDKKRFFHLQDIPKKVVMTDEQKKLFPFGSPVDRSRYK